MSFGLVINLFTFSGAHANIQPPLVDVHAIAANSPTTLTVSTYISDQTLLPTSVNLLRVDSQGKTIATLGSLSDNGANGDVQAGDRIYSIRIVLNEPQAGQVYLKISAALKGALKRISSEVFTVKVYQAQGDEDNDGLPDGWEYAHFGNLSQGPNDDPDHDGFTNAQEYLLGTNPNDAGEAPVRAGNYFEYDAFGRILVKQITLEPE
jgi:hypothetical protein